MTISGFPAPVSTVPSCHQIDIDAVTGVLNVYITDYGFRDLGNTFLLKRRYTTRNREYDVDLHHPWEQNWQANFNEKITRKGTRIWLPLGDFRREAFGRHNDVWQHTADNKRYILKEKKNGFVMKDLRLSVECTYDTAGHLTAVRQQNAPPRRIVYYGNTPIKIVMSSGQEFALEHEADLLTGAKDAMDRKLQYRYNGDGWLMRVTYPNYSNINYFYDKMGRLTKAINRNGEQEFAFEYDDLNRVIFRQAADGSIYTYHYIDQNRRTMIIDERTKNYRLYYWNKKYQIERIVYEDGDEETFRYDGEGRIIYHRLRTGVETQCEYDERGLLTKESSSTGLNVNYAYDDRGHLTAKRDNCGGEIEYTWDGNGLLTEKKTRLTGRAWRRESWERDMMGRILSYNINKHSLRYAYEENSPLPNLLETPCGDTFSYRYDKAHRLLAIKSAVGERIFGYNALDLITRETDAGGRNRIYLYDLQGNSTDGRDALPFSFPGTGIEKYSALDVTKKYTESYNKQKDFVCVYDAKGRLTKVKHSDGSTVAIFAYDLGGRITEERIGNDKTPGFRLTRRAFDEDDNIAEERIWSERQAETGSKGSILIIRYTYDNQGRLVRSENNKGEIREYVYNELSRCLNIKIRRPNEPVQVTNYIYDVLGRLTGLQEKSDYARTGKLWENINFELNDEDCCTAVLTADGETYTGDKAADIYAEYIKVLPQYDDISGYVQTR